MLGGSALETHEWFQLFLGSPVHVSRSTTSPGEHQRRVNEANARFRSAHASLLRSAATQVQSSLQTWSAPDGQLLRWREVDRLELTDYGRGLELGAGTEYACRFSFSLARLTLTAAVTVGLRGPVAAPELAALRAGLGRLFSRLDAKPIEDPAPAARGFGAQESELELRLDASASLDGGTRLTFESLEIEEIAESPENPEGYPAGSGATARLTLVDAEGSSQTFHLEELDPPYAARSSFEWADLRIGLLEIVEPHHAPSLRLRISRKGRG